MLVIFSGKFNSQFSVDIVVWFLSLFTFCCCFDCVCLCPGKFNSTRRTRLQQLIDWCGGPQFEGCLIFDECHKAKNFVPVSGNAVILCPNN